MQQCVPGMACARAQKVWSQSWLTGPGGWVGSPRKAREVCVLCSRTQGVVRSSSVKVTRRSCCNHQGRVFPQAESLLGASELLTTASCRAERHSSEKQLGAVRSSDRGRNGQCIMAARWVAGGNWPSALPGSLKEWRLTRSWHLDKEMPDPSPVMAACPATCFLLTNSSSSLSLVPVFLQQDRDQTPGVSVTRGHSRNYSRKSAQPRCR
ncbi:uncharacterized protein [Macaca nemestrina]|uniref:uncharacterized protein isoform X2 n=1 Tax=Macaca nemestrina TaxID=9545 RepID=UPI0039B85299